MRNMMKKAAQNVKAVAVRAGMLMKDTKGENYVDTAVKILIAVVLGALLLAGLYALFGDVVMPTLTQRIQTCSTTQDKEHRSKTGKQEK